MSTQVMLIILIICWGLTGFLDKLACQTMDPLAIGFIYGVLDLIILPFYYWYFKDKIDFSKFTANGVFWSVVASIVGLAALVLYIWVLKAYEASAIAGYGLSYVGITFLLCVIFLGESFTISKLIGLGLMVAGAYFLGGK